MTIKDFNCAIHENYLTAEFVAANPALFPAAFYQAKEMAALGILLAKQVNSSIAMLPFDYMVEAEALGAKVKWTNDVAGLRGDGHILKDVKELAGLSAIDFHIGRINEVLTAVSLTKQTGYLPCFNLSGFLGITDCLIPINEVFISWRREKKLLDDFFNKLLTDLLAYAALAEQNGAKIFSYADPLAAISLVGPKMSAEISNDYVIPLLKGLLGLDGGGIIHLCGKTSYALEAAGLIKAEIIELPAKTSYSKALADLADSAQEKLIIGYSCINKKQELSKIIKVDLV